MILADKIITLRKKNGWSQEELADKMKVSRQAVSKWEGAQTVPDLARILQLSRLFGVTTDYLLKEDREQEEYSAADEGGSLRRISLGEANAFLAWREKASWRIAIAAFMCVLAVVPLLFLGAACEYGVLPIGENQAGGLGMLILLAVVAAAVSIFIHTGLKNAPYNFLDSEDFEAEYGVEGMVQERQREYRAEYERRLILGVALLVLAPCTLFLGIMKTETNGFLAVLALCAMFVIVGLGLLLIIPACVRWASMEKLLKSGEYTKAEKKKSKVKETVASVYWLTATALYLALSFLTENWEKTWIVWAVAGVLYAVVVAVTNLILSRNTGRD